MSFLGLTGKTFLVLGVANKKSVAWHVAQTLEAEGAKVVYSVRSPSRLDSLKGLLDGKPVYLCDLEHEAQTQALAADVGRAHGPLDGVLHSVAFANFSKGMQPFHETVRADFLQATAISAFSLVELARALKPHLKVDASIVSIGISSQVTAANYGYMSPIKAALESASRFLAKSFSADTRVRFNSVNAGPLKTSASAGIPGYLRNYLHAEKMTFRKAALKTQEVADTAVWLLSPRSSGINGQGIVVDAGMGWNFFDEELVAASSR
ncbi:MAG: enoyl-ACP reductase FabI, partial [Opitutales bacterium]